MIKILDAVREDLKEIHRIEVELYPNPWRLAFFNMILRLCTGFFLVAFEETKLVGYCVGEVKKRGKQAKSEGIGHVMNVAVTKEYQGRGIGTLLIDEIERRFSEKGVKISYLEVRASNDVAKSTYEKRGYQYVKTITKYYGDEDGLIMVKNLTR